MRFCRKIAVRRRGRSREGAGHEHHDNVTIVAWRHHLPHRELAREAHLTQPPKPKCQSSCALSGSCRSFARIRRRMEAFGPIAWRNKRRSGAPPSSTSKCLQRCGEPRSSHASRVTPGASAAPAATRPSRHGRRDPRPEESHALAAFRIFPAQALHDLSVRISVFHLDKVSVATARPHPNVGKGTGRCRNLATTCTSSVEPVRMACSARKIAARSSISKRNSPRCARACHAGCH